MANQPLDRMTIRRVAIDGLIVVAVLIVLTAAYLLPEPSHRAYAQRSRLMVSVPVFGSETNAGGAYATATITLSNVGPTDMECYLHWFDSRLRGHLASDAGFTGAWTNVNLNSGAGSHLTLYAPGSHKAPADSVWYDRIDWVQRQSLA
jgi:hypothetical protein